MKKKTQHKKYFNLIDTIRGMAALMVFLGHLRNVFFKDYSEINSNFIFDLFYFITSLGHIAVLFFFVISGFVITNLIFNKSQNFSLAEYLYDRIMRLWVVLIPSIIFSICLYMYLKTYAVGIINGDLRYIINSGPSENDSKITIYLILGNIFFLQEILVQTFSINAPLWSLSYEFWYYLLFPVILIFLNKIENYNKPTFKFICLIVFILLLMFLPLKIILYFLIWLCGSLIFLFRNISFIYIKTHLIISVTLLLISIFALKINFLNLNNFILELFIIISFSYFILVFLKLKSKILTSIFFKKLSDLSYSLYLFHFPLVLLLSSYIGNNKFDLNFLNFLLFIVVTILIIFIVYLFWFLFERNTNSIKRILKKVFEK